MGMRTHVHFHKKITLCAMCLDVCKVQGLQRPSCRLVVHVILMARLWLIRRNELVKLTNILYSKC
jgi:hypothetical protein